MSREAIQIQEFHDVSKAAFKSCGCHSHTRTKTKWKVYRQNPGVQIKGGSLNNAINTMP